MGLILSVLPLFLAFLIRTPTRPVVTSNVDTITHVLPLNFFPVSEVRSFIIHCIAATRSIQNHSFK